jgi:ribose/xylose/arabinose/galactoside ABC-type transport system permease subunit
VDRQADDAGPAPVEKSAQLVRWTGQQIGAQNLGLILALVVLVALVYSQTTSILLPQNVLNIGQAVAIVGLVAASQAVVLVTGGLDISVGSIAGLSSVVSALAVGATTSAMVGFAGGILAGLAAGAVNGVVVTVFRVNPVIVTLATFAAFRGLALIISNGSAIGVFDAAFIWIGSGRILGIPVPIIILAGVAMGIHVALRYTVIGRRSYAIGGNVAAARQSGMNVPAHQFWVYAFSGAVAGLAGVVLTARTHSGQPVSGTQDLALDAITAAVLGGCAITGGKGSIPGVVLAVVLLGTLSNAMILLDVPSFYQPVAKGALLVIAVIAQQWRSVDRQVT